MEPSTSLPGPDRDRWAPLARSESAATLGLPVPFPVLIAEAIALAGFVQRFTAPGVRPDGSVRPGLRSANRRNALVRFDDATASDLVSLAVTARDADTAWQLALTGGGHAELRARAEYVLDELESALEFILDDGVDEPYDAQLAQLRDQHARPTSDPARAAALHAYASLARLPELALALTELEAFDEGLVAEAARLADALLLAPAAPVRPSPEVEALLAERNQLARLLVARVRLVRSAARYVFRHDPAIAREAASSFERRRRAEARRQALAAAPAPAPTA